MNTIMPVFHLNATRITLISALNSFPEKDAAAAEIFGVRLNLHLPPSCLLHQVL
jgi:hypothetical protein